jgi:hypothetical protein
MRTSDQEERWSKHEVIFEHENGQESLFYMQTNGRQYVLSEHPENQGPHVSQFASKFGDEVVRNNIEVDSKNRPESVQLYAERQDKGQDGATRFDQWEAKTTMTQNVSQEPNRIESQASEWQWKNAKQSEHSDLEQSLGAKVEQGHLHSSKWDAERQNQEFREASLSKTEQSEELRQAAREQQSGRAADEATRQSQEQESQKQKHQR